MVKKKGASYIGNAMTRYFSLYYFIKSYSSLQKLKSLLFSLTEPPNIIYLVCYYIFQVIPIPSHKAIALKSLMHLPIKTTETEWKKKKPR